MARFFASWRRSLKHQRTQRGVGPASYKPWAELLEDRALQSTVTWTNPAGGDWETPGNWSSGAVPGSGDDVVIDIAGQNNFTVTHSANVADSVQSLTSQDALVLSGGSLSLAAGSTIDNTLTISGSTLIGAAALAVNGQFSVDNGTLGGSGTVYLNGGTAADPNMIYNTLAIECPLVNNGYTQLGANGTITPGSRLAVGSGVTVTNAVGATWQIQYNSWIDPQSGPSGADFDNEGTLLWSTTNPPSQDYIAVPFTNGPGALVHVQGGTLTFNAGGTSSGAFIGDPGTVLSFASNFTFAAQAPAAPKSAINADFVSFSASSQVACPYTVGGETSATYGTVQFTGPVAVANSDLYAGAATLDFTAAQLAEPLTFDNVTLNDTSHNGYNSGFISSDADVNITGIAQISNGGFGGSGTVYFNGGTAADPNMIYNTLAIECPLVNNGYTQLGANGTITPGSRLAVGSGVAVTNAVGATWQIQYNSWIDPQSGPSGADFDNEGTLLWSTTNPPSQDYIAVPFTNGPGALVHVQGGTLTFNAGGTSSGAFIGDPGTVLSFVSNFAFAAQTPAAPNSSITAEAVTFGGAGLQVVACPYAVAGSTYLGTVLTVQFTGPVDVEGSNLLGSGGNGGRGVFDFTAAQLEEPLTLANVAQVSILSNADVHITGTFVEGEAEFARIGGSGTVYFDGGTATAPNAIGATLAIECPLVNNGFTQVGEGGDILVGSGVTPTNTVGATWELQDNSSIEPESGASGEGFDNEGTLLRSTIGLPYTDSIEVPFTNGPAALVHVQGGTLTFSNGCTSSGSITGAPGTNLTLSGSLSFTASSSVDAAAVTFSSVSATLFAGSYSASSTALSDHSSTVAFSGPVNGLGAVSVGYGATLDLTQAMFGPGATSLASLTVGGGGGAGTLTCNANLTVTGMLDSDNGSTLQAVTRNPSLTAAGGAMLDYGNLNGYTLINPIGQTIDSTVGYFFNNGAVVNNYGTFNNVGSDTIGGDGTSVFNNYGAVNASAGGMGFSIAFNNYASINLQQGSLAFNNGCTNRGSITGVPGTLLNFAGGGFTLNPASSITADNLLLGSGSVLDFGIGGPVPATGFDQITVNTTASLAGQLQLDMLNGYMPALGTVLTLVEPTGNATVQGTFADGPTLAAPGVAADGWSYATIFGLQYHNDVELTSLGSLTVAPNQSAVATSGIQPATNTGTYTSPAGAVTLSASLGAVVNNGNGTWSWSYTPNNGPTQTQTVTITATDPDGNVATTTFELTLNHGKATPEITWPTPTAITYGTPLSGTQLDATTSISGSFVYAPAAGTVLGAGAQQLSATFTPIDSTDYTTVTVYNSLTVNQAALNITANNQSKNYGSTFSAFTSTITGAMNGDTFNISYASSGAAATEVVGSYPITQAISGAALGNYNLTNTAGTLTVNPAPASKLVFTVPPATGLAGFNLNSPGGVQVAIEDQYGDVLTGNSSTIAIAVSSGPSGGAFISGSVTSAAAKSGVATFTQLALNLSGTYTIKASDGSLTAATATVLIQPNTGILLLDPTGQSLNLSGNAILNVSNDGAVYVNSSNTAAGTLSGNANLTATELDLKGGLTTSGNAAVHGVVNKGVAAMADPLASLAAPTQPATVGSAGSYSGTLQPGTYVGGITVTGNNSVALAAGTYYLKGGGLTVSGNATVTGTGVMLYITGVSSGASSVNLSGNSTVTLTPPTSGAYQGIVLYQARTSTAAITISGNAALNTTGTQYAPDATVNLSGNETNPVNSSLGSQWIFADLTMSGNAKTTITADANNRASNPNAFMVAGSPVNLDGPIAGLTMAQADAAVTTALELWQAAGLDASSLKALSQTKVTIAPLPAPYLGLAAPGVIYLGPNAEGYGWFTGGASVSAIPAGKIDLVTVVTHELGHLFGLMDGNGTALMAPTLAAGVRILPYAGDLLALHTTLVAASGPIGLSEAAGQQLGLDQPQRTAVAAPAESSANKHAGQISALGMVPEIDLGWLPLAAAEPAAALPFASNLGELQAIDTVFETLAQSPSSNDYAAALTMEADVAGRQSDSLAENLGDNAVR